MRLTGRFHATDAYVCFAAAFLVLATGASARAEEAVVGGKAWESASTFVQASPDAIIDAVVARVKADVAKGQVPVVVFDLDSTLFDNGPRQERIAQEFARSVAKDPKLSAEAAKLATFKSANTSFSMQSMLASCGIDVATPSGKALLDAYQPYWKERFFTGAYAESDKAYTNAAATVQRVLAAAQQVRVVYLTGRHQEMEAGTKAAMLRDGIATGDRTTLILKQAFAERDEDFKRRAALTIRAMGHVVSTFDNEPANVAVFVSEFPDAVNVWVRTIDSGRATRPVKGVYTIGGGSNDLAGWPTAPRGKS